MSEAPDKAMLCWISMPASASACLNARRNEWKSTGFVNSLSSNSSLSRFVPQDAPRLTRAPILELRLRDAGVAFLVLSPRCACGVVEITDLPVGYLLRRVAGNPSLAQVVARLRCSDCHGRPKSVVFRSERGTRSVDVAAEV
jgi:hypothetical protein